MAKNQKYVAIFLKEAGEHLASLVKGVITLETSAGDQAHIHELMRNAHTIKGAARMLGFSQIGAVSHRMEDVFKLVESGAEPVTPLLTDVLLSGCDALQGMIAIISSGRENEPDATALLEYLDRRELPPLSLLEALQPRQIPVDRTIDEVRLPVAALDRLQSHLGELVISRQQLESRVGELKRLVKQTPREIGGLWDLQRHLEDDVFALDLRLVEINSQILALRLLPFRTVTDGFARVLRDVARGQGKQAVMTVRGEEVELDRVLLEMLRPAFVHLLTNAVTHGLEYPEERERAGKLAAGSITVSARLVGEEAIISFHDDGRGLDPAAIVAKALSSNLVTPEKAASLSETELFSYLFRPGFSTSESLTDAAGRGVGLDSVLQSVSKVKGSIAIENEPGHGCSFVLTVPRLLLTSKALLVKCNGQRYLLPAAAIEETRLIGKDEFILSENGPKIIGLESVPVASLGALLGVVGHVVTAKKNKFPLVLLKFHEKRLACLVESLYDTLDVVVKKLSPQLKSLFLVSGATVLDDGEPVLILNVADLFAASEQSCPVRPFTTLEPPPGHSILVVDDSVTSRTLEASILVANGYRVETAEDGAAAWAKVQSGDFSLVITDLEMPLMDGLGLVRQIRSRFTAQELPVIMMSSIAGAGDRQRAFDAGVQRYLAKGEFDQDQYLDFVQQLIDNEISREEL
jgi:two-component system chemotaxis sensor kinase CheA